MKLVDVVVVNFLNQKNAADQQVPQLHIDRRREQLISEIEGKLEQKTTLQELFTIQWQII